MKQPCSKAVDKLCGVVESLLADHVEHERQRRMAKARMLEATIAMWRSTGRCAG